MGAFICRKRAGKDFSQGRQRWARGISLQLSHPGHRKPHGAVAAFPISSSNNPHVAGCSAGCVSIPGVADARLPSLLSPRPFPKHPAEQLMGILWGKPLPPPLQLLRPHAELPEELLRAPCLFPFLSLRLQESPSLVPRDSGAPARSRSSFPATRGAAP